MKTLTMLMLGLGLTVSALGNAAGLAVVDLAKVVENSTYLKQQNASLTQSIKPTSTKLEQLNKEIESLQQRAQSANQGDLQKLSAQFQAKVNEFTTTQQGLQAKVQSSIQASNNVFETRLKQAAEQLRKENNVDFILNKNTVIASDAQYDLTDKMIQKINAMK
ncbi:MAG: OmpH family outer membrane protein [Acinetobacter sp.]|nr:OmpH family outer membrane protein [Acinetobacter sp.]MBP6352461.1 OmpH family outer membrane protein [Acinetobacter sp.]